MSKGVAWYIFLTFAGAWAAWAVPIALGIPVNSPLFQLAILPGAFAPAVAALLVRRYISREGFSDARLGLRAAAWPYYLIAWILPLVVLTGIVAEAGAASIAHPDLTILPALKGLGGGHKPSARLPQNLGILIAPQLMITAIIATPLLWGEEFGWRGYLQPRLFPKRPLISAMGTGFIWGLWHAPLIMRGYDFPGHPALSMAVFIVSTMMLSVIFGWLLDKSQTIWVPTLAHSAINAVGAGLTTLWFYGQADPILVHILGVLAWPPLFAISLCVVVSNHLTRSTTRAGRSSAAGSV